MTHLNFHHLRYFLAVAQAGTLTKAAERLNVSPSAVSVQVQAERVNDSETAGLIV